MLNQFSSVRELGGHWVNFDAEQYQKGIYCITIYYTQSIQIQQVISHHNLKKVLF